MPLRAQLDRQTQILGLTLAILAGFAGEVRANEPMWDPETHRAKRDAVIRGTVLSTSNQGEVSCDDDLWKAVLRIDEVVKDDGRIGEMEQVEVYFRQPRDENGWNRCPAYPRMKVGMLRYFFLAAATHWDGSDSYMVELGYDVRRTLLSRIEEIELLLAERQQTAEAEQDAQGPGDEMQENER